MLSMYLSRVDLKFKREVWIRGKILVFLVYRGGMLS